MWVQMGMQKQKQMAGMAVCGAMKSSHQLASSLWAKGTQTQLTLYDAHPPQLSIPFYPPL